MHCALYLNCCTLVLEIQILRSPTYTMYNVQQLSSVAKNNLAKVRGGEMGLIAIQINKLKVVDSNGSQIPRTNCKLSKKKNFEKVTFVFNFVHLDQPCKVMG